MALIFNTIESAMGRFVQFLFDISMVLAVIFIVWGGITYMASGSNEVKTAAAKQRIIRGIIGAFVILAIGVILNTLEAIVTGKFFNI